MILLANDTGKSCNQTEKVVVMFKISDSAKEGFASAFNPRRQYNWPDSDRHIEKDMQAMRSDWTMVGEDLKRAARNCQSTR